MTTYTIPLMKPYITDEIKSDVLEVLDSGYLTEGNVTREFERAIGDYVGVKHAIAVTSCTTGLEVALRVLGIGEGDEVIVPDYTYPATAYAVSIVGAKAVIVDVDRETMLMDLDAARKAITGRTKALIPVSLYGNPLNYDALMALKQEHSLFVVEDTACSLGAEYKSRKVGSWADISVFSMHPRKFITTGEGGVITTDNARWADWMMSYKHFGANMKDSRISASFDMVGTNYKLSNILAAVGLGQVREIEMLLERRRTLAKNYIHMLNDCPEVVVPGMVQGGQHSYQSFCVYVSNRDRVMECMRDEGIEVQIGTYALHQQMAFGNSDLFKITSEMSESLYAYEHCLTLPLYYDMTEEVQMHVVECLSEAMARVEGIV